MPTDRRGVRNPADVPLFGWRSKGKYFSCISLANGVPARITAVHRCLYEFARDRGPGFARLKTGEYHAGGPVPTTGDFVLLDWREADESRILKTLPRKTYFSRRGPSSSGHGEQVVAANFDYVFSLQPLDRGFNPRGLERYLTLALPSGAVPAVLLTKADKAENCSARIRAAEKLAAGTGVFAVSAKTGYGIDRLSGYLKPGKTIVFLGASGVGKSSLINALADGEVMETGGIREKDGRGRHTTTRRQLILLKNGVMAIDMPGMRELGMWKVSDGLRQSFSDIEQYLDRCGFSDCRHQGEPGCAVGRSHPQRGAFSRTLGGLPAAQRGGTVRRRQGGLPAGKAAVEQGDREIPEAQTGVRLPVRPL